MNMIDTNKKRLYSGKCLQNDRNKREQCVIVCNDYNSVYNNYNIMIPA